MVEFTLVVTSTVLLRTKKQTLRYQTTQSLRGSRRPRKMHSGTITSRDIIISAIEDTPHLDMRRSQQVAITSRSISYITRFQKKGTTSFNNTRLLIRLDVASPIITPCLQHTRLLLCWP